MFKKIEGASVIELHGLTMNIPSLGYGISESGDVKSVEVFKRSNVDSEQYWEVDALPDNWEELRYQEKQKQEIDEDYFDPILEEIRAKWWHRRIYGVWFYNNGNEIYLTGLHWFYLTCWQLDTGLPLFRMIDLEVFYMWMYCVEDPDSFGLLYTCKRRNGKCFAKGTKIRMYDGSSKKVEDITNDELVMGNDSTPRKVYGTTTGREKMFKITPNFGVPFECNESHILSLIWNGALTNRQHKWVKDSIVNISVKDYLKLMDWEKEHLVLYRTGWGSHFTHNNHLIPPYMVGLFLGDGTARDGGITTIDSEIYSYIENFAGSLDLKLSTTKITHRLSTKIRGKSENKYKSELRRLDLLGNKHIPNEYLIDSEENRLELLAGLIDTDGYLAKKNYEIVQKNEILANNIVDLARSLGFYVSIISKIATMNRNDGSIYKCKVYRISICGSIEKIPCKIPHKKYTFSEKRVNPLRTGFKIEDIGEGDYYGFGVDDNHLFLLEDGLVVHNTAISSCMIYECISRSTRALGGMQSKTLEDAAEIFDYHIVPAFQQLPDFFIPIYDKSRGSTPKKELLFQLTSVKGRDSSANFRAKQLRSVIDYKESNPKAYDGKRLKRYVGDERGKVEFDVIQAHIMIRKCLVDIQRRIIGKMLITTTVEELGIKYRYDELWKWSDQRKRQEDGRTKSGLYKLFIPADRSGEFNVYGEPHILKNRKSILEERERLRDSPRDLIAEIRKEPLTEEEAFKVSNNECHFNQLLLEDAYSNITAIEKEVMCYGNLIWKDNQMMSDVEWKDGDRDSKFKVPKAFLTHWLETRKFDDIIEKRGNIFIPKNYIRFTSAIDPFANNITVDSINSKAASYVYNRHDNSVMSKTFDKSFIWQYHARPNTTSLQNEDMIKQCFFFGCQLLIENNREGGIRNDFKNFGCEAFMMKLDQYPDYGIPSSESNKSLGVNLLEQHIEREGRDNKIYFSELIYDLIRFNVNETEKSNLSMAAMWTLVASYYKQYNIKTDTKAIQIGDFFKKKKIV